MHSLGDSFGFRRSDEILWSGAEGNFKAPAGVDLLQGDLVEIDAANPGFVKKSATDLPLIPGVRGLAVQYDQAFVSSGAVGRRIDQTRDLSYIFPEANVVIATGAGLKVWVKNLAAVTLSGRKPYAVETRCTATGIAVADLVKWDGSKFIKTTNAAHAIGTVTGEITAAGFTFTLNA